jgi:hypothetical protein
MRYASNENLALLGKRVLKALLFELWFKAELSFGDCTKMKTDLLDNKPLGQRAMKLGIQGCVIVEGRRSGATNSALADTVMALVGAVKRDGGEENMRGVIRRLKIFEHELLKRVEWDDGEEAIGSGYPQLWKLKESRKQEEGIRKPEEEGKRTQEQVLDDILENALGISKEALGYHKLL